MPKTIVELLEVKGIGKITAKKYGEEILELIRNHRESSARDASKTTTDAQLKEAKHLRRIRRRYPNAYKKWTPDDDHALLKMVRQKVHLVDIAQQFKRPIGEVFMRFRQLQE
jgi:hypothetical protein